MRDNIDILSRQNRHVKQKYLTSTIAALSQRNSRCDAICVVSLILRSGITAHGAFRGHHYDAILPEWSSCFVRVDTGDDQT
jgi:hypothetical protein